MTILIAEIACEILLNSDALWCIGGLFIFGRVRLKLEPLSQTHWLHAAAPGQLPAVTIPNKENCHLAFGMNRNEELDHTKYVYCTKF